MVYCIDNDSVAVHELSFLSVYAAGAWASKVSLIHSERIDFTAFAARLHARSRNPAGRFELES